MHSGGERVKIEQDFPKAALPDLDGVAANLAFYYEVPITLAAFVLLVGFQVLQLRKARRAPVATYLACRLD